MSKILLIDPDWQGKDKELPEKFVAKILSQQALQKLSSEIAQKNNIDDHFADTTFLAKMEAIQKRCHNAEVTTCSHLAKIPEGKYNMPKIYYMKKFSENNPVKGYILMGYLENIKAIHIFENVSLKEVRQILRCLAVFEANSPNIPIEERTDLIEQPFKNVFGSMFEQKVLDTIGQMLRSFGDGKLEEKADRFSKILPDMVDLDSIENLSEELGMERVLCHGDLWSMNILWRQNGDQLNLAGLVDYQIAHFGCPVTDLVRMFSACLSGKDRQAHWEELLEDFYGYLKEEGLATIMEKTECLLDDILYFHDRNMKIKRGEPVD
ncbi:hypothetical protein COOONC_21940 [Cooperia oncophora]